MSANLRTSNIQQNELQKIRGLKIIQLLPSRFLYQTSGQNNKRNQRITYQNFIRNLSIDVLLYMHLVFTSMVTDLCKSELNTFQSSKKWGYVSALNPGIRRLEREMHLDARATWTFTQSCLVTFGTFGTFVLQNIESSTMEISKVLQYTNKCIETDF